MRNYVNTVHAYRSLKNTEKFFKKLHRLPLGFLSSFPLFIPSAFTSSGSELPTDPEEAGLPLQLILSRNSLIAQINRQQKLNIIITSLKKVCMLIKNILM